MIIAEDVEGQALAALVVNRRGLKIAAVKAPGLEIEEKQCLKILQYLQAELLFQKKRVSLENADLTMLGTAETITIDKDNTTMLTVQEKLQKLKLE